MDTRKDRCKRGERVVQHLTRPLDYARANTHRPDWRIVLPLAVTMGTPLGPGYWTDLHQRRSPVLELEIHKLGHNSPAMLSSKPP